VTPAGGVSTFVKNEVIFAQGLAFDKTGNLYIANFDDAIYRVSTTKSASVTSISPQAGTIAGGTTVTITGTNLANATAVWFGTTAGQIISDTATQIVVVSPAHAAGTVDVVVSSAAGNSATSAADQFTYTVAAGNVNLPVAGAGPSFALAFGAASSKVVYTFTLTNQGPDDATNVILSQTPALESGVTVPSVVPSSGSFAGTNGSGSWTIPSLPHGTSATLTVTLIVGATAPLFGTVSDTVQVISADQNRINISNETSTTSTLLISLLWLSSSSTAVAGKPAAIIPPSLLALAGSFKADAADFELSKVLLQEWKSADDYVTRITKMRRISAAAGTVDGKFFDQFFATLQLNPSMRPPS
jgi:uncharacterized repeat protein (TIGR01451 family)